MANKIDTLSNISDLLDQVDVLIRDLQLDKIDQLTIQDSINSLYAEIEKITEKTTKIEHVERWGFELDPTACSVIYTRNAPNGCREVWRKANPDRIYIYDRDGNFVDAFDIDWSLHNK